MNKKLSAIVGFAPAFAGEINDTFTDLGAGTGALLTAIVGPVLLFVVGLGVGLAIAKVITNALKIKA